MRGSNELDDDKVRILTRIIREMASGFLHYAMRPTRPTIGAWAEAGGWNEKDYNVGDLVICSTSGLHPWTVGFVTQVSRDPFYGTCLQLREIGSDRLCNMTNESFYVIKGLREEDLLEGQKYKFSKQILKVFRKHGDLDRRYGGIKFIDDAYAEVMVRASHGGCQGVGTNRTRAEPFPLKIRYNRKKVSMKQLYQEMLDEGYLSRAFARIPDPLPADASITKITIGNNFITTVTEGPPDKKE